MFAIPQAHNFNGASGEYISLRTINMILENAKIMWAKLGDNAGTKYMSEEKEWSVDVVVNDEQAKAWTESGVKPALRNKDGLQVITLRKDCVWKKSGDAQKAPMVVDQFGDALDPAIIGNDSVANVQYSVNDWEFNGTKGRSARLIAVQVVELNEYTPTDGDSSEFSFANKEVTSLEPQNDDVVPF